VVKLHALVRVVLLAIAMLGCGERPLEPRDPTPGVPHFKVVTFNILTGIEDDPATIEAIGGARADVVSLQEVTPAWLAVISDRYAHEYPHMLFYPSGSAGLGVLSRLPLLDAGFHPGPNGWHPAWHVLVETPAGYMQLLNVHLRSGLDGSGGVVDSYLQTPEDHLYEIQLFTEKC
jgi:hypothetical protein